MNKRKYLLASILTVAVLVTAFSFQPVRAAYTGLISYITGVGGYSNATSTATNVLNTLPLGQYSSGTRALTDGQFSAWPLDSNGFPIMTLGVRLPGADVGNDVQKVEQQMSGSYTTTTLGTALAIKSGANFIHTCTVSGELGLTVSLYDALTITGTPIVIKNYTTSTPYTVTLDKALVTGLSMTTSGNQAPAGVTCTTRN